MLAYERTFGILREMTECCRNYNQSYRKSFALSRKSKANNKTELAINRGL
jgi:hypothetical protein